MDITFLNALNENDIVLTPNQRLTNTLLELLKKTHAQKGNFTFSPPTIMSFPQFIRMLWKKEYIFISPKKILTIDEEAWLWKTIIDASEISKTLLNAHKTVSLIQSAWHHLKQWRLTTHDCTLEFENNENFHYFTDWSKHFKTLCKARNFIDESSALDEMANNAFFTHNISYKNFYFYHFLEMTPLQNHWITALTDQKKAVFIIQPTVINQSLARFELDSKSEEIYAMAVWAKEKYTENNTARIACVIPTLHQQRELILRIFKAVFNTQTPPVDISAGYALSEFTVIQHMLLLITLLEPSFDYEVFSTYLRSAYFGESEKSMSQYHTLDFQFRKKCSKTTSLKQIKIHAENLGVYVNFPKMITEGVATLAEWHQRWMTLLQDSGWPGQRNLSSTEYQVVKRFLRLMEEVEDYCTLQTDWTWPAFSSLLKTKCQQTIFQPEKEKTAIQILGLLEASGMSFDYLWVMGLEDKTWPSAPSPNPFLPYTLQKKYALPHASAEREFIFCKTLQEQLIQSSVSTILSSAKYDEDKELNPSPLIVHIQKHEESGGKFKRPTSYQQPLNSAVIEQFLDNFAPLVLESEVISGGTSLIQHQALCPFKAFAIHRLKADEIPQPIDIPNALIRGNNIHQALEYFWKAVKTSENLHQLSENDLENQIKQAIEAIHHNQTRNSTDGSEDFFITLEKTRLHKLMYSWLDIEKKRSSFTVIAVEQKREYQYKHITLRMRVDRIDAGENGEHTIIDYKTGLPNIQHWLGSRLKEPQLPLYCISHPTSVSTLCFAQLRWNDLTIKGISEENSEIKTITSFEKLHPDMRAPTWQEQKIQWKQNIDQLMEDFLSGYAAVDPLDQTACEHCHLQPICRIFDLKKRS